jgi:RNA-binding protein YhbY
MGERMSSELRRLLDERRIMKIKIEHSFKTDLSFAIL